SPEASQPPSTAPTRPSSSAVTVTSAVLRNARAASGSTGGTAVAHAGEPASPAYQPPQCPVAPSAARTSSIGTVNSQTTPPCSIAGSARRSPAIRAATQPPTTKAKNEPPMLKMVVMIRTFFQVVKRGAVSPWAPTAKPISPMMRPTATAAEDLHWDRRWDRVFDDSRPPYYRWFTGGMLNTCYNALDLHVDRGRGKQRALVYDSPVTDTIRVFTYAELRDAVARMAGALR